MKNDFRNPAQEFIYVRTYSHWLEIMGRRENWPETASRYVNFIKKHFGDKIPAKVLKKIEENLITFSVMPSMRFLWAAGAAAEQENCTIYNCSFACVDRPDVFAEALYILMCGCGFGFSVESRYVVQLPPVPSDIVLTDTVYAVEDSKAGWADSVKHLVNSLYSGQDVALDYNKVRPSGARLKTMGGRASGPGPLAQLHSFIKETFYSARGRKLTTVECSDILNEIGQIVVVGGVRRSSEISLSDLDDELMRDCKSGHFPVRRYMANNSAVYLEKPDIVTFMREWTALAASGSGERGIFNLGAARKMAPKRRDASKIVGTNPCVIGETEILTRNGYKRIDSIIDLESEVWNGFEWSKVVPKITGTNQDVVTVSFSDGRTLTCTAYHEFHVAINYRGDIEKIKAKDLEPGMKLIKNKFPIIEEGEEISDKNAYTQGFLSADGMDNYNFLWVYEPKKLCVHRLAGTITNSYKGRLQLKFPNDFLQLPKTFVPFSWNLKSKLGWLAGLFDGDGTELKEGGLQLASVNFEFLYNLQKLLSTLGVQSKVIFASSAGIRELPDGKGGYAEFFCQESRRICLGAVQMQELKFLGLKCERMSFNKNPNRDTSQFVTVVDVTDSGNADYVYCFNEPKRHLGIFNGVIAGQCAEIQLRSNQFCVSGNTELITKDSVYKIKDLENKIVNVWNGLEWTDVCIKKTGQNQQLVRVTVSDGSYLDCTLNHRFSVKDRFQKDFIEVKASDLLSYSKYSLQIEPTEVVNSLSKNMPNAYTIGFAVGDGHVRKNKVYIALYGRKIDCPVVGSRSVFRRPANYNVNRVNVSCSKDISHTLVESLKNNSAAADGLFEWSRQSVLEFIAGLADSDGSETNTGGIRIYISQESRARKIQLLLTKNGIKSSVNKMAEKGSSTNYGKRTHDIWYLQITDCVDIPCKRLNTAKGHKPRFRGKFQNIVSVNLLDGLHDTFCFNEPKRHQGLFGNILTYQCNLSEVVVRAEDDVDTILEKIETATWMGVIQACFVYFPYLGNNWTKNCEEERLLGVSLTGQMDAPHLLTEETLKAYKSKAIKIAKKASDIMGIPMPAAITCVKPSGCQVLDTMIISSEGILSLEEIGDIHGPIWQEHDIEVAQESGLEKSTRFFINGTSLVKKLNMKSGVSLTSTLSHQYRVIDNGQYIWKKSENIKEGDIVPYRVGGYTGGNYQQLISVTIPYYNCKEIKQPNYLSEDLAFLLGLYCGDGSNHKKGIRIAGDVNKKEALLKAKNIALNLFGIEGIIYERSQGKNNADLYLNSTHLLAFLSVNNLLKADTYNVDIPLIIRKSPANVIESFVDGYVEADGCYTDRGIVICTVSKKMAKNLPIVLRAISKNCSVKLMPPTETSWGDKMRYRITMTRGRDGQYLMDRNNKPYYEQLDKLGLTTLIPDEVVSVEYFESDTYDIEVPSTNTFVANSYISHNTVSQLVDSASGLHPRFSKYYIRRYRISASDPLFKMIRDQGLPVNPENGQRKKDYENAQKAYEAAENKTEGMRFAKSICPIFSEDKWSVDRVNTWVVSFPVAAPEGCITVADVTAIGQLEWYKKIQKYWCEHNASITVYLRPEEWLSVGDWVYKNWEVVNGISFLPVLEHVYEQAPYEAMTEKEYREMIKDFPKIDYSQLGKYEKEDNTEGAKSLACVSGVCEV